SVAQRPQSRHSLRFGEGRLHYMLDEDSPRHLHGSKLQVLFGAKMRKQAALAHLQFVGQATDGESFEAFHGSKIYRHAKDAVARAPHLRNISPPANRDIIWSHVWIVPRSSSLRGAQLGRNFYQESSLAKPV